MKNIFCKRMRVNLINSSLCLSKYFFKNLEKPSFYSSYFKPDSLFFSCKRDIASLIKEPPEYNKNHTA